MDARLWPLIVSVVAVLAVAGCSSDGEETQTAAAPTTTATSVAEPPATTAAPTTTEAPATTEPETSLDALGYATSDDYVVETILTDLPIATGGLVLDGEGNLYQADFGGFDGGVGDQVLKIAPDGTFDVFAQSDLMEALTANTFAADGTLYQSSYGAGRVFAVDVDGAVELVAEDLTGPTGLVVRDDGSVLVESYERRLIYEISPDGEVSEWVADRRFAGTNGLVEGPDGTLYAINHRDGGLFQIDPDGTVTELHRFPKATSHGAYLDGSLFVTSREAFVVYRYDLETGDTEIIAGNGEPGDVDGRGTDASFGRPNAIAVGPDGALYTNHGEGSSNFPVSIRRITHAPE